MKICHVSFGEIKHDDASKWLDSISYHTKVIEATATRHTVISYHMASFNLVIVRKDVTYRFVKITLAERFTMSKLIAAMSSELADVIVVHGMHSSFALLAIVRAFRHKRIFVQHHGERVFNWPKSFIQTYNDKFIYGYFLSAAEMSEPWIKRKQIAHSKKVFEVLEATSSFDPVVRGECDPPLSFLWVGRIDANKDPQTLIEGFLRFQKQKPTAKLFIISPDVDQIEQLRIKTSGNASSIEFVGHVQHSEMPLWFSKVNFIISTSLFEGSGIAVLEGMSLGCIPILTCIPSFLSMTNNGEIGVLFKPGDSNDLTNALLHASQMDICAEQKRVHDFFVQHLSADSLARRFESAFIQSLEKD